MSYHQYKISLMLIRTVFHKNSKIKVLLFILVYVKSFQDKINIQREKLLFNIYQKKTCFSEWETCSIIDLFRRKVFFIVNETWSNLFISVWERKSLRSMTNYLKKAEKVKWFLRKVLDLFVTKFGKYIETNWFD